MRRRDFIKCAGSVVAWPLPCTSSCSSPSRFASGSALTVVTPVTFPPGRLRLATPATGFSARSLTAPVIRMFCAAVVRDLSFWARSDHTRKPVISEQDSCSLAWIIALTFCIDEGVAERLKPPFSIEVISE